MKDSDCYLKWIEWSDEDGVYIGKCPDLITGIHGDDPVSLYNELCAVVDDVIAHFRAEGRPFTKSAGEANARDCVKLPEKRGTRVHGQLHRSEFRGQLLNLPE